MAGFPRYRMRDSFHKRQIMGTKYVKSGSSWVPTSNVVYPTADNTVRAYQEECWDEIHPGPPYREGGPFYLKRRDLPLYIVDSGTYDRGIYRYQGSFYVVPPTFNNEWSALAQTAASLGAKGWDMYRPVKPVNSLGQFLVEIRDCKRMVTQLKRKLKALRDVGHHYLNVQFGWMPFLRDLRDFLSNGDKINRRMAYIRKNNGKWVKRGGSVQSTQSELIQTTTNRILPILTSSYYPGYVTTKSTDTKVVKGHAWFEAMMKFYIQDLDKDRGQDLWNSRMLRKMWGLELTPALIWELIPFSWMVDYFWDIGHVMNNFSNNAYDHTVAKYAYVMETKGTYLNYRQSQMLVSGHTLNLNATYECLSKERVGASPFGFAYAPDASNLSESQLAILLALGLTKT